MKAWWLSWYHPPALGSFELHSPWWISGCRLEDGADTIVAAVRAEDESEAWQVVYRSYDVAPEYGLERRFIRPLPEGTSPFTDRFTRDEWMAWDADRTCGCPACVR